MSQTITMNDLQKVDAGVTPLDLDGKPFEQLPEGATVTFVSSNPTVATFEEDDDPTSFNGIVRSGAPGQAVITATISFADGTTKDDTLTVNVINSAPGSANFHVGTPIDE